MRPPPSTMRCGNKPAYVLGSAHAANWHLYPVSVAARHCREQCYIPRAGADAGRRMMTQIFRSTRRLARSFGAVNEARADQGGFNDYDGARSVREGDANL
jgi:hypothetical protein